MADFIIKQGDLEPAIAVLVKDSEGTALSLATATGVVFRLATAALIPVEVFSRAAVIDDASGGEVAYVWQTGDTDTVGAYYGEFTVTWSPGRTQTVPSEGYYLIVVEPKL